jgi:hypothetical protein
MSVETFDELFKELICTRVEAGELSAQDDPVYIKRRKKVGVLFNKLLGVLESEEHKQWLRNLDDELCLMESVVDEHCYRQGLKDGVNLNNLLFGIPEQKKTASCN